MPTINNYRSSNITAYFGIFECVVVFCRDGYDFFRNCSEIILCLLDRQYFYLFGR